MELEQALKIMENWQHWWCCNNENCRCDPINPSELGQAGDVAVKIMRKELARQKKSKAA
jgi:hypothetical protein